MLTDRIQTIAKRPFFHHSPLFVEHNVLAHLVAQIDPDGLGFPSRYRFAILLHGWFSFAPFLSAFTAYRCSRWPAVSSYLSPALRCPQNACRTRGSGGIRNVDGDFAQRRRRRSRGALRI